MFDHPTAAWVQMKREQVGKSGNHDDSRLVLMNVYTLPCGMSIHYLAEMMQFKDTLKTRSSKDELLLQVPRTKCITFGDRALEQAAKTHSVDSFKTNLKTHLFTGYFNRY